jgi:hypothetical protein
MCVLRAYIRVAAPVYIIVAGWVGKRSPSSSSSMFVLTAYILVAGCGGRRSSRCSIFVLSAYILDTSTSSLRCLAQCLFLFIAWGTNFFVSLGRIRVERPG